MINFQGTYSIFDFHEWVKLKKVFKLPVLKSPKTFRKFQVIFNSILAIIARVKPKSNFKHYLCIFRGHTPYLYQLSYIVVLTKVINYPHNTSREIVLRHTLTTYLCLVLTKWGHKLRRMDACSRRITWDMSKVIHHTHWLYRSYYARKMRAQYWNHFWYQITEKEILSRKFSAMISKNKRGCRE